MASSLSDSTSLPSPADRQDTVRARSVKAKASELKGSSEQLTQDDIDVLQQQYNSEQEQGYLTIQARFNLAW
jgi:hypothetical protein